MSYLNWPLSRILRYAVSSVPAALLDFITYYALSNIGLHLGLAALIGGFTGTVVAYFLASKFVFIKAHSWNSFWKFSLVAGSFAVLSAFAVPILYQITTDASVAKLLWMAGQALTQFMVHLTFTFREG